MILLSKIFLRILLMAVVSISFGCKTIVYNHPTKSESLYETDKRECTASYHAYPIKGSEGAREAERIEFVKRCLQEKGWVFTRE